MRIAVTCDHGAFDMKRQVLNALESREGVEVVDLGPQNADSVDYPDMAANLCKAILDGKADRGVLMCGTGIGISIAANRFKGIRAALCGDEFDARLSRQHNDSNVLVMGGRTTGPMVAEAILEAWLAAEFEGGRHQRRIDKIDQLA